MVTVLRWLATAALTVGLGMAALTPAPARAQEGGELARVMVEAADVMFRGGYPYYRYGNGYDYDDRLVVVRDRYGRPAYYRQVPRGYRNGPPYGNAYGYYRNRGYDTGYSDRYSDRYSQRRVSCDRNGRCVTRYYDPRYDSRHNGERYYNDRYSNGYDRYDRRERYWDGYRWRTR